MRSTRHHNIYQDNAVCFWTSAVVGRVPIFASSTAAKVIVALLDECRTRCNIKLLAYVIMPDHIHLAVWSESAEKAQRFLKQFLGLSAVRMAALTQQAADRGNTTAVAWLGIFQTHAGKRQAVRVWKERGRAFPVTDMSALAEKMTYIHDNPVRAGLVARPEEWAHSSAFWYASGSGPIAIDEVCL